MSDNRRQEKIDELKERLTREERQLSKAQYYASDAYAIMTAARDDYEGWTRTEETVAAKISKLEELIQLLEEGPE